MLCTALAAGDVDDWNFVHSQLRSQQHSEAERNILLSALTCSRDLWVLNMCVAQRLRSLTHCRLMLRFRLALGSTEHSC